VRALGFVALAGIAACGDSSTTGYGTKGVGESSSTRTRDDAGTLGEEDAGPITDPNATNLNDLDGDGVPNAEDCDPNSKTLKRRIVEDTLGSEKGFFTVPAGFPAASWTFEGAAAYRQMRLADAADVSFFSKESDIGDVQIEVQTASTEYSNAFAPRLRQIFVLVGGVSVDGTLSAAGCGIEVVQGEMPEQKSSIVKLTGTTTSMTTTVLQRVTRPAVQSNEDLVIKLRLEDGAMVCDVSQAGMVLTTATANNLGALKGSVGFFTRQTKALFKNLRVCSLE
jgi:hypothetical protein